MVSTRCATCPDFEALKDAGLLSKEKLLAADLLLSPSLGVKPQDVVEANLAVQMAAIHAATMKSAAGLAGSKTWESWDRQERALNRLTRTFAAQVEALKRYRSKGEQRVYVERVNVGERGQAIVGNVGGGGGVAGPFKNAN